MLCLSSALMSWDAFSPGTRPTHAKGRGWTVTPPVDSAPPSGLWLYPDYNAGGAEEFHPDGTSAQPTLQPAGSQHSGTGEWAELPLASSEGESHSGWF